MLFAFEPILHTDKDYYTVFPDRDPNKKAGAVVQEGSKENHEMDEVYEIGADGTVDIS
jgi:hypothetical protein